MNFQRYFINVACFSTFICIGGAPQVDMWRGSDTSCHSRATIIEGMPNASRLKPEANTSKEVNTETTMGLYFINNFVLQRCFVHNYKHL